MKKLITLDEWDDLVLNAGGIIRVNQSRAIYNGIECPKCKKELLDSENGRIYYSMPAQKDIFCENCDYMGKRYIFS